MGSEMHSYGQLSTLLCKAIAQTEGLIETHPSRSIAGTAQLIFILPSEEVRIWIWALINILLHKLI